MIRIATLAFAFFMAACAKHESNAVSRKDWTYPMTATIVSHDPAKNTVNLANKEVPGVMTAMTMDYEVPGAKVDTLPPDGSPVEVTVHDRDDAHYITDVSVKR